MLMISWRIFSNLFLVEALEVTEKKTPKKQPIERSKHVPYENDSAWEPDQDEEEEEVEVDDCRLRLISCL